MITYRTSDFRGFVHDGIRFGELRGNVLYERIKQVMTENIKERGIPASVLDAEVKSGGIFGGSRCPMLLITYTGGGYFDIGIYVNDNMIYFPLLGESAENTKANKKQYYTENGNFIRAALINPDEFALQQESEWQRCVLDCLMTVLC